MINLIQGFYFQGRPEYGIRHGDDGPRVFVRDITFRTMFSGMFGPEHEGSFLVVGKMIDHIGESVLTDIELDADTLCFTKQYERRHDLIVYRFKKYTDDTWRGTFEGTATGTGQAHCVITTVLEDFLLPKAEKAVRDSGRPVKRGGPHENSLEKYRR